MCDFEVYMFCSLFLFQLYLTLIRWLFNCDIDLMYVEKLGSNYTFFTNCIP